MEARMFEDKVEKILELSRKIIGSNANNINLCQRMLGCTAEERSRAIVEVMRLLKSYHAPENRIHLDLRENDLTVENLQSLSQYDGNRIEIDVSSNNLAILSEEHEQAWASIIGNPCLKLETGWGQPVRSVQMPKSS
jgi:hypothetical protein